MVIELEVFGHESLHLFVLHLLLAFHQLAHGAVVNVVSHHLLGGHLVAVGHCYIVHLVAEADDEHVLCVGPSSAHALPYGYVVLRLLLFPVSHNELAAYAHPRDDVAKLAVSVCALVQVHEVHVHGVPWNLCVELCMEVEQRLVQYLQAVNPHLCRREGVHPCDDAYTLLVVVGLCEDVGHFLRAVGRSLVNHLYGQPSRLVESVDHYL